MRYELYSLREAILQAAGSYQSTLAKGQRLLDERTRFRQQTAAQTQEYRYKDMAFRIFRDDAIQKYHAQFDMAARYVSLASKAYDYETNLRGGDPGQAGSGLLGGVVRARAIGLIHNGIPQPQQTGDGGLADVMARMSADFSVLKPQLGVLNPQPISLEFSLRSELLRVAPGTNSSSTWQKTLAGYVVPDLNQISEFKQHCLFENRNPEPGFVIEFPTTVVKDLNYFAWPLGAGESKFNDTDFATKIKSIGVSFRNFHLSGAAGLPQTVYVYLVPIGDDVMRSPRRFVGDTINYTREWKVLDQWLPVPFQLSGTNDPLLTIGGYIPLNSLSNGQQPLGNIRGHPNFLAWNDSLSTPQSEPSFRASLLISRSVWNTSWMLVIPASSLKVTSDYNEGINRFIYGGLLPSGQRDNNGISDIRLRIDAYSFSGR